MVLEQDQTDRAVLTLLSLAPSFDLGGLEELNWDAIDRIQKDDLLSGSDDHEMSIVFTDEDLMEAERLLDQLLST